MPANTEILKNIPRELREPALWTQYYLKPNKKRPDKKPDKHPIVAYTNRANLRSLDYLLTNRASKNHDGYQRLVEKGEGLVFIDLDHCRDASTGETKPWAQEIIDAFDTYTELSASRTGYHLVCKAVLDDDFAVEGNPVEIYSAARRQNKLIAVTGDVIDPFQTVVENRQEQAAALLAKTKGSCPDKSIVPTADVMTEKDVKATDTDLPVECLDGWLGQICRERMSALPRAYSWLALLAAASVYAPRETKARCNLFVDLDGPVHSGKSSAFELAFRLLSLDTSPLLLKLKAGSAEGLTERVGDVGGAARLLYPDEAAHLLEKSMIERASFPRFLTTAFYDDKQELTVTKRKALTFNARLSVAGGTVSDQFGDLFGSATTGGLYDRFLFGKCPAGYQYLWRPLDDVQPAFIPASEDYGLMQSVERPVSVCIDHSVFDARDYWIKVLSISPRVAELCIRTAIICASFDGKRTLTADMLTPALELAKYQTRVRLVLQPNPGENDDARMAFTVRNWMTEHARDGRWVGRRLLSRSIHAERLGPGVFDRALRALQFNQEIEIGTANRMAVVRLVGEASPTNLGQVGTVQAEQVSPPRARDECPST